MAKGKSSKKEGLPPRRPAGAAKAPVTKSSGAAPGAAPGAAGETTGGAIPTTQTATTTKQAPARGKPTQAERLEAARRARKRKAVLVRAGIAGGLALVILIVAVVTINNRRKADANVERLTAGSCKYDTRTDPLVTANRHVPPASYAVDPPSGGNHDPSPAPGGFYEEGPSVPADANLVHSLEHGFVVIWHRPDASEQDLQAIRGVSDEHSDDVIVVPRASLGVKVAATAWHRRLLCGEVEPAILSDFVELYRNDSPEPDVR